jgi:hypothetical protein
MTAADVCSSRYTGKERDTESGNDYFGARYYGSSRARFVYPSFLVSVILILTGKGPARWWLLVSSFLLFVLCFFIMLSS